PTFAAQDPGTLALPLGSATGFRGLSDGMGKLTGVIAAARDVNGDGFDDIVVGDGASERVDLYRGGTDWGCGDESAPPLSRGHRLELPRHRRRLGAAVLRRRHPDGHDAVQRRAGHGAGPAARRLSLSGGETPGALARAARH